MADVTMRRMLEAGVHFGHQTRFWNPKMSPYIFGERNNIHIVNLEKTLPMFLEAAGFIRKLVADGGTVLFVGSKRAARQAIAEQAERCNMPHVSQRWLGGMLTNFKTIRQSVKRLGELEEITADGSHTTFTKKEILTLSRERDKLRRALGGIKDMDALPDAVFIIDVGHEEIAVREARKLGIAVLAVVDTNCSPEHVDYAIPGNDDAMRAIELYAAGIADAVLDGKASMPEVPTGDDEFVELDEEGKPTVGQKTARKPVTKKRTRTTASKAAKPAEKTDKPDTGEAAAEATDTDKSDATAQAADAPEAEVAETEAAEPQAAAEAAEAPAGDEARPEKKKATGKAKADSDADSDSDGNSGSEKAGD